MIFRESLYALYRVVKKPMGMLKRTENSLNQHIKLKHPQIWQQIEQATFNENI